MKITQSFIVARPIAAVWGFFQDVPSVAACLPGTELIESRHDGVQRGKVAASLGPFKATFEGEATITSNPVTRSGHVEGRGVDKRGGSHSRMSLDYRLAEQPGGTRIDIDVDLTLSGPIGFKSGGKRRLAAVTGRPSDFTMASRSRKVASSASGTSRVWTFSSMKSNWSFGRTEPCLISI